MSLDSLLNKTFDILIKAKDFDTLLALLDLEDRSFKKAFSAYTIYNLDKQSRKLLEVCASSVIRANRSVELDYLRDEFFIFMGPIFFDMTRNLHRFYKDIIDKHTKFMFYLGCYERSINLMIDANNVILMKNLLNLKPKIVYNYKSGCYQKCKAFSKSFYSRINIIIQEIEIYFACL